MSSTYPETIGATPADYSGTPLAGVDWEGKVDGQRWSEVKGEANLWLARRNKREEGIKGAGVHW